MWSSFFPKKNLFHPNYIFWDYITFYSSIAYYYQDCLYPKLHRKMQKNVSQLLKKKICLQGAKASLRSLYLLRSEIQTIIRMLLLFLNVCKQTFHISNVDISQNVKDVLMWNLQHVIFMWRRRYWQILAKFCNIHRETAVLESLFNKVAGLQLY